MTLRNYEAVLKAAADPTRVRILKMLEGGEMCVCQIFAVLSLSQSTVSRHLFLLRAAGLIRDRKEKKWIHYSLEGKPQTPYAARILRSLREWMEDDPVILADRGRTALARELGPAGVIGRGMKLPSCKTGCGARPRKKDGALPVTP